MHGNVENGGRGEIALRSDMVDNDNNGETVPYQFSYNKGTQEWKSYMPMGDRTSECPHVALSTNSHNNAGTTNTIELRTMDIVKTYGNVAMACDITQNVGKDTMVDCELKYIDGTCQDAHHTQKCQIMCTWRR